MLLRSLRLRVPIFAWVVLLAAVVPAGAAAAEPPAGEAGWMYDPGKVVVIDLTLSPTEKAKLEADPGKYVKGTFSLAKTADNTPGSEEEPFTPTPLPVEIRLKGNVGGSFRTLGGKAAFKLKFKKSEPFLGLRKMTLNNMVEDWSLLHEALAYRVFRAMDVAAPRTGFAYVRLNGDDYGIYLNLENLDKVNLERWFGTFEEPPQHLYEGEHGVDVMPGAEGEYEVDEGVEGDRNDLEALIATVNASDGPGWSQGVASVADLEEMTRMWAIEKYIGHWDGYSGREGEEQPNNYYLYSDAAGRFQMLPWGTDLTWMEPLAFDGPGGLLFNKCLGDPACAALYREQLRALGKIAPGLDLAGSGEEIAALLKPWEEVDPRLEHPGQVDGAVAATLDFIAERPAGLSAWLAVHTPTQAPPHASESSSHHGSQVHVLGASAFGGLRVGASRLVHGVLVTHVHVAAAGTATQRVTLSTASGQSSACATREYVARSGSVTLSCVLSDAARRRLRARWLRLEVATSFVTTDRLRASYRQPLIVHKDVGL